MKKLKLIIAGGGTGGHIFPGLAIAETWMSHQHDVVWVGSNLGKEKIYVPEANIALEMIPALPMKGKGLIQKLKTALNIPKAIFQSIKLIKKHKPDVILGVGGYASFAMVLAGYLKSVPTAIAEQNAFAGLSNRILSRFVKIVFLSFEDDLKQFPKNKTQVVGNAIRSQIQHTPYPKSNRPFCIFVTGGSLGAVALNKNFCEALDKIKHRWSDIKVIHQTGDVDFQERASFYKNRPTLQSECYNFIKDIKSEYQKAHLILCRAGASTATEIALIGRPALFIPYPYATDDHQTQNALYYTHRHAGFILSQKDLNPDDLAQKIEHWMDNPEELAQTAQKIHMLAKKDARKLIVEALIHLKANYV